ncbi:MAG: 23S rRNA (adenine(2503)-C(2))-methyltransferase RlmN [Acidobacteria bacterium]|nr:23S rRNA (adenine(2503)-C(2))-methyltransferase RlmN [Acidobacteriota bacterium]
MNAPAPSLNLLDRPASSWRAALDDFGYEPYRGDQVAEWVFQRGVFDFERMTNLPADMRTGLASQAAVAPPEVAQRFVSSDRSRRYLLRTGGGELVEAVYMPTGERATLCISSQVGCRFACTFCQTGTMKLQRSLSAGEIVGQVLSLLSDAELPPKRTNVVFMGQGEPLDNLPGVIGAVEALQDPAGPGWSWRRITVSTVGLVPALAELGRLGERRPRIAVSLNASTDAVRSELMPINRKYPIADLVAALRDIPWRRRERVTFEYVLLRGVNDSPDDAKRLGKLLRGLPAKVNLIPWNPIETMPFARPDQDAIDRFRREALGSGLDVLVRYSRGADIGAACGQLQAAHDPSVSPTTVSAD